MNFINNKCYKRHILSISRLLLIIWVLVFCLYDSAVSQDNVYNLVKIHVADTQIIEELEADPAAMELVKRIRKYDFYYVSNIAPGFLWAMITDNDLIFLKERGCRVEQIMKGPEIELHKKMVWGEAMVLPEGYHTYDEIVTELQEIHRQYSNITTLKILGQTQQHKKNIYAIKLSDNAELTEDEPKLLFSAAIHGNEIMGTEVCMALLHELLKNYNKDEQITHYVNSEEIWFIPVINVDGYEIATRLFPSWRKNARDNDGDEKFSLADGVDLNRNFDYNWQTSGSSEPSSRYFRGTTPFSEREARLLTEFVKKQKFVFSATYHSAEARVYFPWRSAQSRNHGFTPENDLLSKIANNIAGSIKCLNENYKYLAVRNTRAECYTTNYYYGVLGTIDFMIELGKYDHVYPLPVLNRIIEHNIPGAFYLLERTLGPGLTGKITNAATGQPLHAEVRILDYDNAEIVSRTTDPLTGRYYRVLEPGCYQVLVIGEDKQSRLFSKVVVASKGWSVLNVELNEL